MTTKTWYDSEEDILNIELKDGTYWKSIELKEGIVIDIAKDGTILSIEILAASKTLSRDGKKILDKATAIAHSA